MSCRKVVSSTVLLGWRENALYFIYIFGWFNMKSPLAGQSLSRHSQAAVFCSFAMSERYASTPGQPWLVWAELPARLPSSPAKHGVCHVKPPWLPSIFRGLEVSLGCSSPEKLAHQVSYTYWSSAGQEGLLVERHICYSLRVTTVKVSIPPAKQFLAKGSVISDFFSGGEGKGVSLQGN